MTKSALMLVICLSLAPYLNGQNIDSLEVVVSRNTKKDTVYLDQLYQLGDYYLNRNPQKAHEYIHTGYIISKEIGVLASEAAFGRMLGVSKRRLNKYDSAKYYLFDAVEKSIKAKEQLNLGLCYSSLGNLYRGMSKYDSAIYYFLEGIRVFETLNYPKGLGTIYNGLGNIYILTDDIETATRYLKLAVQKMEGISEYGVAVVSNNIGNIFFKQNQFDSALIYYLRSKEIKEKLHLNNGLDDAYLNIGLVYSNTHRYQLANEYLLKSLKMREEFDNKEKLIQVFNNLAELNIIIGENKTAQDYLDKSRILTEEIGSLEELKYILKYQLRLDSINGNYHSALRTALKLASVQDSLLGSEKTKQIAELQTQYETEKKDNEIASLSQQAEIQQLQINQRNIQLIGAIIVLILAAIGGYAFYQQRKLKHQQAVSDMEQRMLRLQMNPHFIFNALASIQTFILQSNTKESVSYLARFGKLMRQILEHSREESITVGEEVDMLTNYLQIQQLRFKDRFEYQIEIDPKIDQDEVKIPPLFAQPFVENAIEHGLREKEKDGLVTIRFGLASNQVKLEVEDNGQGLEAVSETSSHKSLATIISKERLEILGRKFHQKFSLSVDHASGASGVKASVTLPVFS